LRFLVVFVPRTSSTPVATWFWQTEGRSAEHVILGVRPSKFILLEFQSPSKLLGNSGIPVTLETSRLMKFMKQVFRNIERAKDLES
jgi:hypothetical protein